MKTISMHKINHKVSFSWQTIINPIIFSTIILCNINGAQAASTATCTDGASSTTVGYCCKCKNIQAYWYSVSCSSVPDAAVGTEGPCVTNSSCPENMLLPCTITYS